MPDAVEKIERKKALQPTKTVRSSIEDRVWRTGRKESRTQWREWKSVWSSERVARLVEATGAAETKGVRAISWIVGYRHPEVALIEIMIGGPIVGQRDREGERERANWGTSGRGRVARR